eukprot:CAMPEP_0204592800 /NCGR_PEP_ID=MMETSP0661-20131031/51145_1 /ASSEMBLY_ACC=CAM_ASM_000606 /TAXON_ID=109239 /ORGANISM="Alexandrium margalefi, Strain AMGDE01CS-322" /LENGTH=56 /DNA_ID=CAMNT_0051603045 /DNA_START=362 /DNA_END=529 /DNA_ORIENTATION=+
MASQRPVGARLLAKLEVLAFELALEGHVGEALEVEAPVRPQLALHLCEDLLLLQLG